MGLDIFALIDRVTFELSNYCNYAKIHPKCPAHFEKNIRSIGFSVVQDVLVCLGENNFKGIIAWHQYSEPMLDPRLFTFLTLAKILCPDSKKLIWTNGANLDQRMLSELEDVGVTNVVVTAYFDKERLQSLKAQKMTYQVIDPGWVEVLDVYDRNANNFKAPCYSPFTDLIITVDGKIGLCCRDVERRYSFGDLNQVPFGEAINAPALLELYNQLSSGERKLAICQQCGVYRSWKPHTTDGSFKVGRLK
jgi:hypothetical protein